MVERLARWRDAAPLGARLGLLGAITVAAVVTMAMKARIPQWPEYHDFSDQRTMLGIPHALNVLSNVPFVVIGALGLWWMLRRGNELVFRDQRERLPALVMYAGLVVTGFGSSYYHLAPDDWRLMYDRLGMVVGFSALLPLAWAERVSAKWAARMLWVLLGLGVASVFWWEWTELRGAGDLRWYGLAQAYAFVMTVLVLLLTRPHYTRQVRWAEAIACYGVAKLLETFDPQVYAATGVSGHSLKHVAAAAGGWFVLRMFMERRTVNHEGHEGAGKQEAESQVHSPEQVLRGPA